MIFRKVCLAALLLIGAYFLPAEAQSTNSVKHIQSNTPGGIASGVWVGNMFYLSGQLPSPVTPADREKGTPAVYGNTQTQAENTFNKIKNLLKEQGLGMGDVVMMRVYMTSDPAMENKLDFAGMNAAYNKFFGTPDQPNKPARSTVQVAALVSAGAFLEVEVQAASSAASGASSLKQGFTAQQAATGKVTFANSCAVCHMPDLRGSDDAPALAGVNFMSAWGSRRAKDLLDYIITAMPPSGSAQAGLSGDAYASIAAYILQSNGAMAGDQALSASTMESIVQLTNRGAN